MSKLKIKEDRQSTILPIIKEEECFCKSTETIKVLHIWMGGNYKGNCSPFTTFQETEYALKEDFPFVETTQPHFCSTKWLTRGYRIFVHMLDNKMVEIKLGKIEGCDKDIRAAHNLERLLLANCFGLATLN